MKKYYNCKKGVAHKYQPGDKVMLEGINITSDRPMKKLGDKRYGPFVVEKKVGQSAYKLKLPPHWRKIYPVFNEILLTPYWDPQFPSQQHDPPPPPDIIEGQEEFKVERIIDVRTWWGKKEYLVL